MKECLKFEKESFRQVRIDGSLDNVTPLNEYEFFQLMQQSFPIMFHVRPSMPRNKM